MTSSPTCTPPVDLGPPEPGPPETRRRCPACQCIAGQWARLAAAVRVTAPAFGPGRLAVAAVARDLDHVARWQAAKRRGSRSPRPRRRPTALAIVTPPDGLADSLTRVLSSMAKRVDYRAGRAEL